MNYDDLSKLVNDAYRETGDIRETMVRTGLTFDEVWDMTGMKDWFEWISEQTNSVINRLSNSLTSVAGRSPQHWVISASESRSVLSLVMNSIQVQFPLLDNTFEKVAYHYRGNAEGSTLRQTLGVLLTDKSDYPLRRVGSGDRMTFTHLGECWLDDWMQENAFVCWVRHPAPWEVEEGIFEKVSSPLNLQDNQHHPFHRQLSSLRKEAKRLAREEPIAREYNQRRWM